MKAYYVTEDSQNFFYVVRVSEIDADNQDGMTTVAGPVRPANEAWRIAERRAGKNAVYTTLPDSLANVVEDVTGERPARQAC